MDFTLLLTQHHLPLTLSLGYGGLGAGGVGAGVLGGGAGGQGTAGTTARARNWKIYTRRLVMSM